MFNDFEESGNRHNAFGIMSLSLVRNTYCESMARLRSKCVFVKWAYNTFYVIVWVFVIRFARDFCRHISPDTSFCFCLRIISLFAEFANRDRELVHFDQLALCACMHVCMCARQCICVMQSFFFFSTCRPFTSRALTVKKLCMY